MATRAPASLVGRVGRAAAHLREASHRGRAEEILDVLVEHARLVTDATHAWAARSAGTAVVSLRSSPAEVPCAPLGEIITYLPSIGAAGSDAIDLEILLASRAKFAELVAAIASDGGKLEAVPRARAVLDTQPPPGERAAANSKGSISKSLREQGGAQASRAAVGKRSALWKLGVSVSTERQAEQSAA